MALWSFSLRWISLLCLLVQSSLALNIAYCSSQNTGGGGVVDSSVYQSNGRCHDQCDANFAFAIVQGNNCWCSNYIPASQQPTGKCNDPCPGFPNDLCGSASLGLFGYIALDKKPSGTAGAAASTSVSVTHSFTSSSHNSASSINVTESAGRTSTSTLIPSSTTTPRTLAPVTNSAAAPTVIWTAPSVSKLLPSSMLAVTTPSDSSLAPKSTLAPTAVTNVQVVTLSGNIVTQTVTTTPTSPSGADMRVKKTSSMNAGYIAAAVIASIFGIGILCALLFWCYKRKNGGEDSETNAADSGRNMQRNTSVNSKAGLLDNKTFPPTITTRFSHHNLDFGASDGPSPVSPMTERRSSKPLVYDQRLNPNALMANDNGSRTSLRTLDDHRDYGRMLKVMNPDQNPARPSLS